MSGRSTVPALMFAFLLACSRHADPAPAPAADSGVTDTGSSSLAAAGVTGTPAAAAAATSPQSATVSDQAAGAAGTPAAAVPRPDRVAATPTASAPDASSPGSVATTAIDRVSPVPVAAPVVAALPVTVAVAVATIEVERETPLARETTTTVDPGASFRVDVGVPVTDGRLSLRDEQDAMVPASGTSELSQDSSRYRLIPQVPLVPGSRYTLHLDGAVTHDAHDAAGHAYHPVVFALKTAGERPPATKRRSRKR